MRRFLCSTFLILLILITGIPKAEAATQHITVGVVANTPPYQFLDENGNCVGLHIDLMNELASRMDLIVEYRVFELKQECDAALESGEIDVILGVPVNDLSDKKWLTSEISISNICIAAEHAVADAVCKGEGRFSTAYESGTVSPSILTQIGTHQFCVVGSQKEVLSTVASGKAHLMVGSKESLLYQMEQLGVSDNYTLLNNSLHSLIYTIRVKENDYLMLRSLNRCISEIRMSAVYEQLCDRWLISEKGNHLEEFLRAALIILCALIAAVLLYLLISTYLRSTLKKQVEAKTAELSHMSKLLEQQLAQLKHESDFRNRIIRYSKLGMVLFDSDYKIMLINKSAQEMIASAADTGDDIRTVDVYREILNHHGEQVFLEQGDIGHSTVVLRSGTDNDNLREVHYRYILQPILKEGTVAAVLLSVEDITREEQHKQQFFEAEKSASLNTLAAGLAHEIKNPLMAIRTFASVGAEGDMDPQFIEDFCRYVPIEIDRINKLIEALISYATPSRGEKEQFDLAVVLEECAFFANTMVDGKKLCVSFPSMESYMIWGNRDQVKQILINLIVNGLDSMKEKLEKGRGELPLTLSIQIRQNGGEIEVMIRDEGCGMTQEKLNRCRDPFYTTKKHGSGLGLALCDQYMREHHGRMLIDSIPGDHTIIRLMFRREEYESESIDH